MIKDGRKTLGTFWCSQFLQVLFLKIFIKNTDFQAPLETILGQFTAQLRKSKDERSGAKHSPLEKKSKKNEEVENQSKFEFQTIP